MVEFNQSKPIRIYGYWEVITALSNIWSAVESGRKPDIKDVTVMEKFYNRFIRNI